MPPLRSLAFATALVLCTVCFTVALADTTENIGFGDTATTHQETVNNSDGSTTTIETRTEKDVTGKVYLTRTIKKTTFPYSTTIAKFEYTQVCPDIAVTTRFSDGDLVSDQGFFEDQMVRTVAPDGSGTFHQIKTEIDPKTRTKTVTEETESLDKDKNAISGERHTITTPPGGDATHKDEVWDPSAGKKDEEGKPSGDWVPAVQDAAGKWVAAAKPIGQAPPQAQPAQPEQPVHHNNTGAIVGGVLVLGGLIAALASHGGNNTTTTPSSPGVTITFSPNSLTGCRGGSATATVHEPGYSGPFSLNSSNGGVVQPASPTTTGSFAVTFGTAEGSASVTATDNGGHKGNMSVTVNC